MTVVRTDTLDLLNGPEAVRDAVHRAVARMRWWRLSDEADGRWRLSCRWPGLLPTRIDVSVEPDSPSPERLILTATSQSFVQGDIFRLYPRMLRQLRRELAAELGEHDSGQKRS